MGGWLAFHLLILSLSQGDLISEKEGKIRYDNYKKEEGSYIFFFQHKGTKLW